MLFFSKHLLAPSILLSIIISWSYGTNRIGTRKNASIPEEIKRHVRRTDLVFTENKGQIKDSKKNLRPDVLFKAEGSTDIYLLKNRLSYVRTEQTVSKDSITGEKVIFRSHRVDVEFMNSNKKVVVKAECPKTDLNNYYFENAQGATNVRSYQKVTYQEIFPLTDIVFYGSDNKDGMEYDFILSPGADPDNIRLLYKGDYGIQLVNGALKIKTIFGEMEEFIPKAFQLDENGKQISVAAKYRSEKNQSGESCISFTLGKYDKTKTLIIDPWITYYGGMNNSGNPESAAGIDVDSAGNIIAYGNFPCNSLSFPFSPGAFQTTYSGIGYSAFIAKFDKGGTRLWSTFLNGPAGGFGSTLAGGITVDDSSNVIVDGQNSYGGFPVTSDAFQTTGIGGGNTGAFITKFNRDGHLRWSTFLHGSYVTITEKCTDVASDKQGNVIVTGTTSALDFPIIGNAFQTALSGPQPKSDAFVMKFDRNGAPIWSTYYGGTSNDVPMAIATDDSSNIVIVGTTVSSSFPVSPGAFQSYYASSGVTQDAFVVKFDKDGNRRWATFWGGVPHETCNDVIIDTNYAVLITGYTRSALMATSGAFQTSLKGVTDAYIVRFNGHTGMRQWSTYLGGTTNEEGAGLDVDTLNNIYTTGYTTSANFPATAGTFQTAYKGGTDVYIAKFDVAGNLLASTFLGGSASEGTNPFGYPQHNIASYNSFVYVLGTTYSLDFPVTSGAYQSALATSGVGANDHFIAQFCWDLSNCFTPVTAMDNRSICLGGQTALIVTGGNSNYTWYPATGLSSATGSIVNANPSVTTTYYVHTLCSNTATVTVTVNALPTLYPSLLSFCDGTPAYLEVYNPTGAPTNYTWTPSVYLASTTGSNINAVFPSPGIYTYTIYGSDSNNCTDTVTETITINALPTAIVTSPISVCSGTTGGLTCFGNFLTYEWVPSTGLSFTNTKNTSVALSTPGLQTYSLFVTDNNFCKDTASTSVYVYIPSVINLSGTSPLCIGDSTDLNASGGISYVWIPANDLNSNTGSTVKFHATIPAVTNYSVTATDVYTCKETSFISITVVPGVTANAGADVSTCYEIPVNLTGAGGNTYSWIPVQDLSDPSNPSTSANPTVSTTYTLTVTSGSCSSFDVVTVTVNSLPSVYSGKDTSIYKTESILLHAIGAVTYSWLQPNTLSCNTCPDPISTPDNTITYTLTGTDQNNCANTDEVTITILAPFCDDIFVPNAFSPNGDGENDELEVKINTGCFITKYLFEVYDRWGNKVFESDNIIKNWDGRHHGAPVRTDVYVYKLSYRPYGGDTKTTKGSFLLVR